MTFDNDYREFNVSVFHKGLPVHLVTLHENSEANACRRAKNAIFMAALRDGREFGLDDLHAEIFHGKVPA